MVKNIRKKLKEIFIKSMRYRPYIIPVNIKPPIAKTYKIMQIRNMLSCINKIQFNFWNKEKTHGL